MTARGATGATGSVGAAGETGSAGKKVYVHVGAPKTGTTYLQDVLWNNCEALAEDGFLYPLHREKEHRIASLDLQGKGWGGRRDPRWEGAWDRLAARVRQWPGQVAIISNELLGGATPEQAKRAVESLQPAEVHVVFTARDLARQLVSDWQEQIKHTHTVPSERFIDELATHEIDAREPFGRMFWGLHDAVRVLGSWSAAVPPDRIHVVTVPQPGARKGLLLERFAGVIGMDPSRYDLDVAKHNTSMGLVETELVRRVNITLGRSLGGQYDRLVRVLLAQTILAARLDPVKIGLPEQYHSWVMDRSKQIIAGVEAAGYGVVGDLDELLPQAPDGAARQSYEAGSPELLPAAVDAIAGLLQHLASTSRQHRESSERVRRLEEQLEQRRRHPIKTLVRDLSERHPALMRARTWWWHTIAIVRRRGKAIR